LRIFAAKNTVGQTKNSSVLRDQVDPETAEHANGQPEKPDGEQAVEGEGDFPKGCGT
jgi:hypothetical protein